MSYTEILQQRITEGTMLPKEACDWLIDNANLTDEQAHDLLFPDPKQLELDL